MSEFNSKKNLAAKFEEESEKIFQFIEKGLFNKAVLQLDSLMKLDLNYPGLLTAYRTARFWLNREEKISNLAEGQEMADFLMKEWDLFDKYLAPQDKENSEAYEKAMRFIFFKASENYKIAFQKHENTTKSFDLLLNLGSCFIKIKEYESAIKTLEYARSLYSENAFLLSSLAEAYFQAGDLSKSLLYFREAFFINPSEVDLNKLKADSILTLVATIKEEKEKSSYLKEWIPVYAFALDIFYVRRNINKSLVVNIEKEIYNLEVRYQKMNDLDKKNSKILPRLINLYLWMFDYYEFQNYNFENIAQIRKRLIELDKSIFFDYFNKLDQKKAIP